MYVYYDLFFRDKIFFWINSLRLFLKIIFLGRNIMLILNYLSYYILNWFICSVVRGDWIYDFIRVKIGYV